MSSETRHHFFRREANGRTTWWSTCREPLSVYWLQHEAQKYRIVPVEGKDNEYLILDKEPA